MFWDIGSFPNVDDAPASVSIPVYDGPIAFRFANYRVLLPI